LATLIFLAAAFIWFPRLTGVALILGALITGLAEFIRCAERAL